MNTFRGSEVPTQPPRHVLTLQQGEEQLQPYLALLDECIQHGWNAWDTDYASKQHILRARSRAAIVYDEIVFHAESKFSELPNVVFKRSRGSFHLYLGDKVVIRFKKIGKNGKCYSIDTRQQILFSLQVLPLPGMEKGTMLHAGYALDDLQQKIFRKSVVCQFSNRVLWTIELQRKAGESGSVTTLVPQSQPPQHPAGSRFTEKETKESPTQKRRKARKE